MTTAPSRIIGVRRSDRVRPSRNAPVIMSASSVAWAMSNPATARPRATQSARYVLVVRAYRSSRRSSGFTAFSLYGGASAAELFQLRGRVADAPGLSRPAR